MTNETMRIEISCRLRRPGGKRVWLYVHGRYGCKEEGEPFARIVCPEGWQVLAIDLPEHGACRGGPAGFDPWHAVPEAAVGIDHMPALASARPAATSLGAWFSMLAFAGQPLIKALFVSPVLDMERLICDMMLGGRRTAPAPWRRDRNGFRGNAVVALSCMARGNTLCCAVGCADGNFVCRRGQSDGA